MTQEEKKQKHRYSQRDVEINYDFLSDDDSVYSEFDGNFDVPCIVPTEAFLVTAEETAAQVQKEKIRLTPSAMVEEVLDFAEYLGNEIVSFFSFFIKAVYPFVAIPLTFIFSFLRKAFVSLKAIKPISSSFASDIKRISFELSQVKKASKKVKDRPLLTYLRAIWKYFLLSFSRHSHFWKSVRNVAFPVSVIVLLFVVIPSLDKNVSALQVIYNGQPIGYVENERDFDQAKAMATKLFVGDKDASPLTAATFKAVRIKPHELSSTLSLSEGIISSSDTEYTMACGVYIDGEFLCAVQNESDARAVFDGILAPHQKKAASGTSVAFVEEIQYVQSLYPTENDAICDSQELKSLAEKSVRVKVMKTRQRTEKVPYETVKKNSATLYKGTTKTTQKGQKGEVLITELLTYIDGKLSYTSTVSKVQTKAPVNEIILVGTKQGNIYSWYSGGSYYQGSFIWPTRGANAISSYYGYRSAYISGWSFHGGIDIITGYGNSTGVPVVASSSGTVVSVSKSYRGYGHMVLIDHGGGLRTRYAHMQPGSITVYVGQKVYQGQQIGRIGSTGNSTGPHLHFEVLLNGVKKNPMNYIRR